jgi:hypothetical protein
MTNPTAIAVDNGAGSAIWAGQQVAAINYAGKSLLLTEPDQIVSWPMPDYESVLVGTEDDGSGGTYNYYRTVLTGVTMEDVLASFPAGGTVKVRYRVAGGDTQAVETAVLSSLSIDLTKGYAETVTPGSARFRLGDSLYTHQANAIYRDPSPATGAGSLAGSLDPTTGKVLLTSWTAGGANTVALEALVTEVGGQPVDSCQFRTPAAPIRSGTFQIRWSDLTGVTFDKTLDGSGILEDNDCAITIDYTRGVVRTRFGRWRAVADLTPEDMAEPWYSAEAVVNRAGTPSIWKSRPALAASIVYNAVAQTTLPPDSNLLGLDAARLPPDGNALIYRVGMLALIHHTDSLAKASLLAAEVFDCGRTRLYRVVIEDANGLRLTPDLYTVNRELGTVTMADPLDLTGYAAPYTVYHSVADLQRVRETDINGRLTFLRPVSHAYPQDESYVSGMLYIGTLQARYSNLFEQTSWTDVWSDALIGDAPLASFSDALYPIAVTNAGAYPDRFLVRFTNSVDFQVIGENLGLIGVGDINHDCAPINPLTGQPYFRIPYQGWGGGWAAGNCLRFNLAAACYPVDAVRAVQPSDPTGLKDSVELLLIGNVDA